MPPIGQPEQHSRFYGAECQKCQRAQQVELERYSLFYVLNLMVPSALVMLVDVAAFALPADCAERIPFKVTLLFSYTVFLLLVTDILPPFRDTTPVLGLKRSFALGCDRMGPDVCGQECFTDRLRI
ncbi:5-hydroxytryptamine receptor 3A-like [Electrophorus electricus]|uniref:5-hydroxytryptamine receptor 3A-like n=1 Tax=Electrophorus electricus TaxID=8005 RepID=UPI0015D06F81|nr:5-hydroxytryptamine receptor 3A-like [Electrophorus electricus]